MMKITNASYCQSLLAVLVLYISFNSFHTRYVCLLVRFTSIHAQKIMNCLVWSSFLSLSYIRLTTKKERRAT